MVPAQPGILSISSHLKVSRVMWLSKALIITQMTVDDMTHSEWQNRLANNYYRELHSTASKEGRGKGVSIKRKQ